jgi:NAD(P)-dependent dehydrogenase (short-subunit alcohol dehydrogenase family)
MSRVVLVTGASAGIGAATAHHLAKAGYTVYGTSRSVRAQAPTGVHLREMDVRDAASVNRCVEAVVAEAGRLDVLVNNAGFGIAAAVEDTTPEDMLAQFDTNFLGALRVCRAVLPHMRAQRTGRIVQITSLAARISIPFQGAYSASKAALASLSEALSIELKPFGIFVSMIEPGDTRTLFTAARVWTKTAETSDVYRARATHAIAVMARAEQAGTGPNKVAALVERAIRAKEPKLRYVSASGMERFALTLQRVLPERAFEGIITSNYEPKR